MTDVLVDSNVILDIATEDSQWFEWSSAQISMCAEQGSLIINPIIYAEVSVGFAQIEALNALLPSEFFRREQLPWDAAFIAGKAFQRYRQRGGTRRSPLPDFYIGAHPVSLEIPLLTRDVKRYRTEFPTLQLISL